nr:hypothetical protein [Amycolatopsis alkalitolerans]
MRCRPATSAMIRPTRVDPVKFTRATSRCAIRASTIPDASSGALLIRLTAPAGTPASCSTSTIAACVHGVCAEDLRTTVLP